MDTLIPLREQRDNDLVRLLLKHKYYLVELRGLEPLTSSMPWWLRRSKRRAASVDVVPGRAGGATSIQPGSPSVCPPRLEPPAVREPGPCGAEPIDLGLDQASVRVHAGSRGASQAVGCSPSSLAVPTHPVGLAPRNGSRILPYQVGRNRRAVATAQRAFVRRCPPRAPAFGSVLTRSVPLPNMGS
jgi:hypothetical protein